jgi:hypothetical protein
MFFDTSTGDVYVNDATTGETGGEPGPRTIKLFAPATSSQIRFLNGAYEVITAPVDYSAHPVTGVSWFGAVKYCNWLTLDQGMPESERCYTESTDPTVGPIPNRSAGWHPATISTEDWLARDLTDAEKEALVLNYRGFRLPMDDAYDNADPTKDAADAYNEWYKAAAWHAGLRQNMTFGFGRNSLNGADANFRCSGDGFENAANCQVGGTTPGGYFDGTIKGGVFTTRGNDNSFNLFDLTGNVHHWMQGPYAPPNTIDRRTLRGGSWNDPAGAASLRTDSRTLYAPPTVTSREIGFRVVRTSAAPTGDFDSDGDVDAADFAPFTTCQQGPAAARSLACVSFDFDEDADVDLRDIAAFQRLFRP